MTLGKGASSESVKPSDTGVKAKSRPTNNNNSKSKIVRVGQHLSQPSMAPKKLESLAVTAQAFKERMEEDVINFDGFSPDMTAREVEAKARALGHNNGNISHTVFTCSVEKVLGIPSTKSEMELKQEKQNGVSSPSPPSSTCQKSMLSSSIGRPGPVTPADLTPLTPSVYLHNKEEAYSPQLLELCLQKPIVVVRNIARACDIDLSLYTTKSLVQAHPNHPVEIRSQMEQTADENWDPGMNKQVSWYKQLNYLFMNSN